MKGYLRAFVSPSYWRYCFSWLRTGNALLAAFGVLWLAVEIVRFFSPSTGKDLAEHWALFLLAGFAWAGWKNRPSHRFSCRLNNRDVAIEIAVADMFQCQGALIVGTNNSFDTEISDKLISPKSVQGQFTQKYYHDVKYLDHDISEQLINVSHEPAPATKIGKHRVYDVGTVVQLAPNGRRAYLLAMARINDFGVAGAAFEDVRRSLAKLWDFIAERGSMEPLVVPVLGSGFGRLTETRSEIIREIIKSFAAACASKQFCPRLTIAIRRKIFMSAKWTWQNWLGFCDTSRNTRSIVRQPISARERQWESQQIAERCTYRSVRCGRWPVEGRWPRPTGRAIASVSPGWRIGLGAARNRELEPNRGRGFVQERKEVAWIPTTAFGMQRKSLTLPVVRSSGIPS